MNEQLVLEAYRDGSPIKLIMEGFQLSKDDVKKILLNYKEQNMINRRLTDEIKRMIAERDINGIARRQISLELEVNINTVKKACEKFGQALKEKATSDKSYTRINRKLDTSTCPSCSSEKVNYVDLNTYYCMDCGDEYEHYIDHVLRINWEYLDE
ncbi:hypothetical protein PQE75_gp188 [Bacillus phage vB_BcoS-136]|uniref:Uncharacterized protein n=1 Tax=Bacillus phage vB_BcoS-136 TaxID=2419619 RepID=A0A3G3BW50_9CAUD|nr:hypothetical protein PQE75_gp188 [Bacillus phage vB_BcoS-136]AYP68291.1 hypothetical protein vBBcoS136_00177 [Bacillus phage vB_BcoS-136]